MISALVKWHGTACMWYQIASKQNISMCPSSRYPFTGRAWRSSLVHWLKSLRTRRGGASINCKERTLCGRSIAFSPHLVCCHKFFTVLTLRCLWSAPAGSPDRAEQGHICDACLSLSHSLSLSLSLSLSPTLSHSLSLSLSLSLTLLLSCCQFRNHNWDYKGNSP